MASVELTMVPSISKRIPSNVWVSAGPVKVPSDSDRGSFIVRLRVDRNTEARIEKQKSPQGRDRITKCESCGMKNDKWNGNGQRRQDSLEVG